MRNKRPMNEPDLQKNKIASPLMELIEKYYAEAPAECPYGFSQLAIYKQVRFENMTGQVMDVLFDAGYRRNGNSFYNMNCKDCDACVPIKLNAHELRLNRNQKRVWGKNSDVKVEVSALKMSEENLALLDAFLESRYAGRGNSSFGYYSGFFLNTFSCSMEIRYRVDGKLLGVSIVDLSDEALNAVYFYFDPEQGARSPGTFNILYLAEFAKKHNLNWLYLGYWIKGISSMSYKAAFKPHYLLIDGVWRKVKR